MIYVSKIGETQRYKIESIYDDGAVPARTFDAACDPCRKLAKKKHPTMSPDEPVRCYHVAVRGIVR